MDEKKGSSGQNAGKFNCYLEICIRNKKNKYLKNKEFKAETFC
jgi:hypothetical protein